MRELLAETAEAWEFRARNGRLPLAGVEEISPTLEALRASGGAAAPEDFRPILAVARAAEAVRRALPGGVSAPRPPARRDSRVHRAHRPGPQALRHGRRDPGRRLARAGRRPVEAAPPPLGGLAQPEQDPGRAPRFPGRRGRRPAQRPLLPPGDRLGPIARAGDRARPLGIGADRLRRASRRHRSQQRSRPARRGRAARGGAAPRRVSASWCSTRRRTWRKPSRRWRRSTRSKRKSSSERWPTGRIPELSDDGGWTLSAARHPLLDPALAPLRSRALARPGRSAAAQAVVPLDFELPAQKRLLVVSGPNAGGKTVVLRPRGSFR